MRPINRQASGGMSQSASAGQKKSKKAAASARKKAKITANKKRERVTCPECGSQVLKNKLRRHLRRIHGTGATVVNTKATVTAARKGKHSSRAKSNAYSPCPACGTPKHQLIKCKECGYLSNK